MPDVTPRFKGTDTATGNRPWVCKWGNVPCERSTPCNRCRGKRVGAEGRRKQRAGKKLLGVPDSKFHGRDGAEENWRGAFIHEVKSQGFAKPIATKFLLMEQQAMANKAEGDARPFCGLAMPAGWGNDGIVMLRASVWMRHIVPLIQEYGGIA